MDSAFERNGWSLRELTSDSSSDESFEDFENNEISNKRLLTKINNRSTEDRSSPWIAAITSIEKGLLPMCLTFFVYSFSEQCNRSLRILPASARFPNSKKPIGRPNKYLFSDLRPDKRSPTYEIANREKNQTQLYGNLVIEVILQCSRYR